MNFLGRANNPRLHQFIVARTSSTPPGLPTHATPTPTAATFSSATQATKLRPTPSSRAYIRYLSPLPNTSISASSPLPSTRPAASRMSSSSSTSTPASTQPVASSTPSRAPPSGSNQNAATDASHPHPRQGGDNSDNPSNDTTLLKNSQGSAAAGEGGGDDDNAATGDGGSSSVGLLPALPAPGSDGATTTLEVDGKAVVLDHLGPMVVGRDGTVSRIANWHEMTEIERRNTLRVLGKRNQVRLAALRGEEGKAA